MTYKSAKFLSLMTAAVIALAVPANAAAVYQKDYVGKMEVYRAKYEDTLVHLARKYGLGFVEMRAANPRSTKPSGSVPVAASSHVLSSSRMRGGW